MFSFRQKIFFSYVLAFCLFAALTFPVVTHIVRSIANKAMEDRADELIAQIQTAPNNLALIRRLKDLQSEIFFRVSVVTEDNQVIYDSHTKHLLGPTFSHEYLVDQPEVWDAYEHGVGYREDYSEQNNERYTYFAKSFDFHGQIYIIRTAFPSKYFHDMADELEIAFLILTTVVLLLFCVMTWFIINHFTRPIQNIINAIVPYQEGRQATVPELQITEGNSKDEFNKLAMTLNSLSAKIQKHIDHLIFERNEKEAILESLVEGVVAVDGTMGVTYLNGMAQGLLNKSPEDLVGGNYSLANEPIGYALLVKCQQERRALTDMETLLNSNTGEKIYLDLVAVPIEGENGAILVMQDQSTHYKLLEMRKDFIANASHELKTPITIIHGFAEAMHDNPDLPQETRLDILSKIVRNCHRMTGLIKDLLTLSDVENIPLSRLKECDLGEITKTCCSHVQDMFPEAIINIEMKGEEHFRVVGDPSLLELAILNLIENAAKYSKPPAKIDVALDKSKSHIILKIKDQGIGIPQEDLPNIFERFYTVDKAHSQKMGGSGLGLSIVQTIIRKHFGEVSVSSQVGIGTTFTMTLPTK